LKNSCEESKALRIIQSHPRNPPLSLSFLTSSQGISRLILEHTNRSNQTTYEMDASLRLANRAMAPRFAHATFAGKPRNGSTSRNSSTLRFTKQPPIENTLVSKRKSSERYPKYDSKTSRFKKMTDSSFLT
jgi:hypothetical protein